ncbi:patatin-like phospholipase family protein [Azomonas macrocytogenes]|uniref:PNPLA domain-containing protein n=1 Tax=Azomonas macrocytogenes TaxID=69962 RepID=A0A839T2Q8_AZOMA|nr:patatin-like phospholipase family protein [Azomonas macrocytogenes]MBB3102255.1 hypothetical protein [Azomonas macrocytogenes]
MSQFTPAEQPATDGSSPKEDDKPGAALAAPVESSDKEDDALKKRWEHLRKAYPQDTLPPELEKWGLALSGGGIRSATLCFGVLRGLAENKLLHRFDYLSTVSGGGYIGAALGRLYQAGQDAKQVEEGLAKKGTTLLWWLRSNGRYLKAAGRQDLGMAFASALRGCIASLFEVSVLLLLVAAVAVAPAVALKTFLGDRYPEIANYFWWWACLIPIAYGAIAIARYWFFGLNDSTAESAKKRTSSIYRHKRTENLATSLWWLLILAGLACLYQASEYLLKHGQQEDSSLGLTAAVTNITSLVGLLTVLRLQLPRLQRTFEQTRSVALKLGTRNFVNVCGLLVLAVLLLLLTMLTLDFIQPVSTSSQLLGRLDLAWLNATAPALRWIFLLVFVLLCFWVRRTNFEVVNFSSLHNYYRARIERAYISVGNYAPASKEQSPRFPETPLQERTRGITEQVHPLLRPDGGDDTPLSGYQPHKHGGPIHLISCCINQTVDDRTGNYNADRKGIAMTVSALGLETGTRSPIPWPGNTDTLSRWVAISGAAASSGMGSRTSPGAAVLLFLTGFRLGYWFKVPGHITDGLQRTRNPIPETLGKAFLDIASKTFPRVATVAFELLARFPGLRAPVWYLSDGGHFDNTGVYALLKRKLKVIVLVDAGADPDYRFEDLENLVRKARIDYDATIDFSAAPTDAACGAFGDFAKATPGQPCLLSGRITYHDRSVGTLLVAKPRLLADMPLDLRAYGEREKDSGFPQQSIGDQFFDEAQWESYHQLGRLIGLRITRQLIANCHHHCQWPGTA